MLREEAPSGEAVGPTLLGKRLRASTVAASASSASLAAERRAKGRGRKKASSQPAEGSSGDALLPSLPSALAPPALPSPPPRVLVVGAGVSGLSAAHTLRTASAGTVEVVVLEGRNRLGGRVHTVALGANCQRRVFFFFSLLFCLRPHRFARGAACVSRRSGCSLCVAVAVPLCCICAIIDLLTPLFFSLSLVRRQWKSRRSGSELHSWMQQLSFWAFGEAHCFAMLTNGQIRSTRCLVWRKCLAWSCVVSMADIRRVGLRPVAGTTVKAMSGVPSSSRKLTGHGG